MKSNGKVSISCRVKVNRKRKSYYFRKRIKLAIVKKKKNGDGFLYVVRYVFLLTVELPMVNI